jgi:threonine synthase
MGETSLCPSCGGIIEYRFSKKYLRSVKFSGELRLWRYRSVLPSVKRIVSLSEGGTPLHRAERLGEFIGMENLLLKDETQNPTNSFKDRSGSLMVSDALSLGYDAIVCATNGNHGASIAAYTAKANMACHLIVPKAVDLGKLAQMMMYDTEIVEAGDKIEDAIERSRILTEETGWYQATTELNPLSIEGLKTISYELVEQGAEPDWVVVAMGSGVTLYSLWKGFTELESMGLIEDKPRLIGVQARGCSPIVEAYQKGSKAPEILDRGETRATAIRVMEPLFGGCALHAIRDSYGFAISVSDDDMIEGGRHMAKYEGIFAEPASAATVACLTSLVDSGAIDSTDVVVSLITSSGLKTQDILRGLSKRKRSPGIAFRFSTKENILRLIAKENTYGYAIWKRIGKEMTLGAVYQHLSDLEERGLIKGNPRGKRKIFEITERGKRVLSALDELQVLL